MAHLLLCSSDMLAKSRKTIKCEIQQEAIHPMTSGNGFHSYIKNSSYQRKAIEASEALINKSISQELEMNKFSSLQTFRIADLGCSVGPNTLLAVQNIIDAVRGKFEAKKQSSLIPKFQVFFNDQASNDFNQLFVSLPPSTEYFAAGVPGSFYDRLFPNDSLHFVHSSFACQWLSRVPEAVLDKSSPAWNKGKIQYLNSSAEVLMAFIDQFGKDMDNFLNLRAHEIVDEGLLALILPGRSNETPHSKVFINHVFEQLECALLDMAKEGKIDAEKIDSFNIAEYIASLEEVESIVHRNGCFSIKMMETIPLGNPEPKVMACTIRAVVEGTIKEHFGGEILDELFQTKLVKNLEDLSIAESCEQVGLYVLLKRA